MRAPTWLFAALTAALTGVAGAALAQRAVRSKDAPTSIPDSPDDDASPPAQPLVNPQPSGGKGKGKGGSSSAATARDGGLLVKPTFKDDLTPEEVQRAGRAAAALDCNANPCERVVRKRSPTREILLHLRPATPRLGEVTEVVIEVSEILDPPDPEIGEKKPLDGLTLTGHLEGVGRYTLVPIDNSAGSYGFHFTPAAKGLRRLTLEGAGPTVEFDLPIAQPPPAGSTVYELHPYEPRPGLGAVGRNMADLGSAWGGLWAIAQGTGHGDAAALAKTVQQLAKAGISEAPSSASRQRGNYADLARSFSESTDKLSTAKGGTLKETLQFIEDHQCSRCHAAFAWGLTSDVSDWPSFKVSESGKGEAE